MQKSVNKFLSVLKKDPFNYSALVNLGVTLRRLNRYESAKIYYQRALSIKSDDANTWSNYGNLLCDMLEFEEAENAHNKALELGGETASNLYNAGVVPFKNNAPDKAIELFKKTLELDSNHHNAKWNIALSYLQNGDYKSGFKGYENRLDKKEMAKTKRKAGRWNGESLKQKRILLTNEQGFGDMVQFARFAKNFKALGAHVIVEVRPELERLFKYIEGIDDVVVTEVNNINYDFYLPLLSSPFALSLDANDVLMDEPYIKLTDNTVSPDILREGLNVGLVWASKPGHQSNRSCPLHFFLPLMDDPAVSFYSFQIGQFSKNISQLSADALITDLSPNIKDFYDTAIYMSQMDLVISIDSSPVHIAGALGVDVWVPILKAADWRWLLNREDSPWYPSARLFRQHQHHDWCEVIEALLNEFELWKHEKNSIHRCN
jgi:Tetratricopeptide repeat